MVTCSVEVDPCDTRWRGPDINRLSPYQSAADLQKPMSQRLSSRIDPTPRRRELSYQRKVAANLLVPSCQIIATEAKDRLHGISQNTGWQGLGRIADDRVLAN